LSQEFLKLSINIDKNHSRIIHDIIESIKTLPNFLTKHNGSFRQLIHEILLIMSTSKNKTDVLSLQHIAFLLYKILIIQKHQKLWNVYLKSGNGELLAELGNRSTYSISVKLWPKNIHLMIQSISKNKTSDNTTCMNFVTNTLELLEKYLKHIETELRSLVTRLPRYSLSIQQMLIMHIQENLNDVIVEFTHQIELVHFDYHIRALKLEFLQHHPSKYQVINSMDKYYLLSNVIKSFFIVTISVANDETNLSNKIYARIN